MPMCSGKIKQRLSQLFILNKGLLYRLLLSYLRGHKCPLKIQLVIVRWRYSMQQSYFPVIASEAFCASVAISKLKAIASSAKMHCLLAMTKHTRPVIASRRRSNLGFDFLYGASRRVLSPPQIVWDCFVGISHASSQWQNKVEQSLRGHAVVSYGRGNLAFWTGRKAHFDSTPQIVKTLTEQLAMFSKMNFSTII